MKKLLLLALFPLSSMAANTAVLNWTATTQDDSGATITSPVTYNVYQGVSGAAKTLTQSGVTATTFTATTGLTGGSTVCWEVSAIAGGVEGPHSAEACKTFPVAKPLAPTALTVK